MRHFERRQEMPVAPRLDQVCVSRETVMAKLFRERIIIPEALLVAGGSGPSKRETGDYT